MTAAQTLTIGAYAARRLVDTHGDRHALSIVDRTDTTATVEMTYRGRTEQWTRPIERDSHGIECVYPWPTSTGYLYADTWQLRPEYAI